MIKSLNIKLHPAQKEFFNDPRPRVLYSGGLGRIGGRHVWKILMESYQRALEDKKMKNTIVRAQQKPTEIVAFQWNANEPFLREFVKPDDLIHFRENKLEVWNSDDQSWINVPHLHWIIKDVKGNYRPISPELFERTYTVVE